MVEYRKGYFARSKAGHDKGKTYVIIEGTYETGSEEIVVVTDGDLKPLEKPKKKKTKHIQVIHTCDHVLADKMKDGQEIRNEDIRRAIKEYLNR